MTYTEEQLTEWFPPEVKPVHVGVYQRHYHDVSWYCYWDGKYFSCGTGYAKYAHIESASMNQALKWRGLKQQPAESLAIRNREVQ